MPASPLPTAPGAAAGDFGQDLLWRSFASGAERDGMWPLTQDQWQVARVILGYYQQHRCAPALVRVGRSTGLTARQLFRLFPLGPVQSVLAAAGVPYVTGGCG